MIFATVGTNEATFDRLLRGLEGLGPAEELVVQHGPSAVRPPGATCIDFLPFDQVVEHIRRARVVVTHAGVGSIMVSLANGRRPIVMPRQHRYGEAVDDHQVPLAIRLQAAGLVTIVDDPAELRAAIDSAEPMSGGRDGPAGRLSADLGSYLDAELAGWESTP